MPISVVSKCFSYVLKIEFLKIKFILFKVKRILPNHKLIVSYFIKIQQQISICCTITCRFPIDIATLSHYALLKEFTSRNFLTRLDLFIYYLKIKKAISNRNSLPKK